MIGRLRKSGLSPNAWYVVFIFFFLIFIYFFANFTVNSQTGHSKLKLNAISGLQEMEKSSNVTSYHLSSEMAILKVTGNGDFLIKAISPNCSPTNNVGLESFPQSSRVSIEYRAPKTWGISSMNPDEENYIVFKATGPKCPSITGESPLLMKLVLTIPDQ